MTPNTRHSTRTPSPTDAQSSGIAPRAARHHCRECGRTYARRDHLVRHVQSHAAQRPFICPECGKGFTRNDLLLRHLVIHNPDDSRCKQQSLSGRVLKACDSCAAAKVKCHDDKPCCRCLKRGLSCTTAAADTRPLDGDEFGLRGIEATPEKDSLDVGFGKERPYQASALSLAGSSPPLLGGPFLDSAFTELTFHPVDDLAEYPTDATLSTSAIDAIPPVDMDLGIPFDDIFTNIFAFEGNWERLMTAGRIKQATQAFESSLWYSFPQKEGKSDGLVGEDLTAQLIEEEYQGLCREAHPSISQRFSHGCRDDLLVTLAMLARDRAPESLDSLRRLFPPTAVLNVLLHGFFHRQDRKIDSWIHSASFQPGSSNMELTAAIIAASALNASSPVLRQLGTDLSQLLRPVILNRLNGESVSFSKLQLYQAFLLSLQLNLWHDEDACLYRAGWLPDIIPILLRRELRDRLSEATISPTPTDDSKELARKWSLWVTAESRKRLMTRLCVYDNQLSMTLGIRTSTTFHEYRLSSPQPRSLWLAKNPLEWQQVYLSQHSDYTPRVVDLLGAMPTIQISDGFLDLALAMKLIFHQLGGLIVDCQISSQYLEPGNGRTDAGHHAQSRRDELEASIKGFERSFNRNFGHHSIGPLMISYLVMRLKASIGNIEILAGKDGEHESQRMYHIMRDWPETADAREAIWHAGQILRQFKMLVRLTSFQIIIAYHAGLVLFAFSLLSSVKGCVPTSPSVPAFYLNGSSAAQVDEFIRNGSSYPMLQSDFRGTERMNISLFATKEAVEVISEIILNRTCNCADLSPRLVMGLVKLLRDLASAIHLCDGDILSTLTPAFTQ